VINVFPVMAVGVLFGLAEQKNAEEKLFSGKKMSQGDSTLWLSYFINTSERRYTNE
jgi:hypothetical protein